MNFTHSLFSRTVAPVIGAALLAFPQAAKAETQLAAARNLATEAQTAARIGVPLIVMVSLPGCPHCEVVGRSHLLPRSHDDPAMLKALVRQVEINGQEILRDFDGRTTTHAEFARRDQIRIAPVVMFFAARGRMAAEPLVWVQ